MQKRHLLAVGVFELLHFFDGLTVVAEVVVAVGGVLIGMELEDGRGEGIDHERDDARGVGFERELRHRQHEVELLKEELLVLDVGGRRLGGRRASGAVPIRGRFAGVLRPRARR